MADPVDLARVDRALLRLRRMWDAPAGVRHEGEVVEGSTLLVCLAVAEHLEDGTGRAVGILEVSHHLGVTHSTASRLVTRAVAAGMVARDRSPADPRRAALTLTAAGTRFVAASREFRTALLHGLLAGWSDSDVGTLAELLDRFAATLHPTTPERPRRDVDRPPRSEPYPGVDDGPSAKR